MSRRKTRVSFSTLGCASAEHVAQGAYARPEGPGGHAQEHRGVELLMLCHGSWQLVEKLDP